MPPLSRSDLLTGEVYYILRLTLGGTDFYLSTDRLSVPLDDGTELQVADGIEDLDWTAALDLFGDSPGSVAVPLSVIIPDLDVGNLVAQGHDLSAGTGELSRWVATPGTTWEDREVLLVGTVSEPSHGAVGEPLRFSLVSAPFIDRGSLIGLLAVVDAVSWSNADSAAVGATYPEVFGSPGLLIDGTKVPGSPGYIVDTASRYLLIAGHEVNASTVSVKNISNGTGWGTATVSHVIDGRGVTVAVATLFEGTGDGEYHAPATAGDSYVVSWPSDGAKLNRRRDGTLEDAGEVLDHYLDRTTLRVDRGRTAAVAGALKRFKLAGYIDEPGVSGWEWLKANVLPLLPVSILSGPEGLYPVIWPYRATARDAVAWLDVARLDAERVSDVQYTRSEDVANDLRISFGLDIDGNGFRGQVRATGDPSLTSSDDLVFTNAVLRASYTRYGAATWAGDTDIVYDAVTASQVVSWLSYAKGVTTRAVTYSMGPGFRTLDLGDVVVVTDAEISWEEQVCWVEGIGEEDGDRIAVTLRTVEAPGLTSLVPLVDAGLTAPVAGSPPVISGSGWVGDDHETTNGTWTGTVDSYSYQWTLNGSDISGAMSSTYEPDTAGLLRVEVTATNGAGSTTQTSAPLLVVQPDTVVTVSADTVVTLSGATVVWGRF